MGSKPIGYSASRVSALIGLNKYKTPLAAFQEIKEQLEPGWNAAHGYTLPVFDGNAATRWGNAFEPAIIKLAEERESINILDRERFYSKAVGDIVLTCHIDGAFGFDGDIDTATIHEGKTTNAMAFAQRTEEKQRWGDDLTDQVPEEYQVQTAVQRICTGADLVKLSVLVFPKAVDDWEIEGWECRQYNGEYEKFGKKFLYDVKNGDFLLGNEKRDRYSTPDFWAHMLDDQGYFHTYELPRNEALESAIIETVTEIHHKNVLPGIPPEPQDYDDIRRLLSRPCGTIIAPLGMAEKCNEYSEITRQLGKAGPLQKRRDDLRVEILNAARKLERSDWLNPTGKLEIISQDGGHVLVSFAKQSDDKLVFRAKRA